MPRLIIAATLTVSIIGAPLAWQEDKVVPVHQEPRHQLVFDSPGTRILDIQIPPGDTTLFHTHSDPILYVTMGTSTTRSQNFGEDWPAPRPQPQPNPGATAPTPARLGRMMSTTTYGAKPYTHRVNNIGQTVFRLIGVTNTSAGDASTTPSADFDATPELTNNWFRGYRWALTSAARNHRHANPVAVVLVTGRAVAGTTALDQPGSFAWIEANTLHSLHAAEGAAEVVEIEVRRPH